LIQASKYIRIERDLEFKNPGVGGRVVYYDLITAGFNPDYPEIVLIEKSKKMPDANLSFVEHSAIIGFAKRKSIDVLHQAVYSERDHDKFDLVRLEIKARDNDPGRTPIYGHRRDLGTLFSKKEIYESVNEIARKAEQTAKHIENQNQEMKDSELGGGDKAVNDEVEKLREAARKQQELELEQRKKKW
jgi:hypothetical protein